MGFRTKSQKNYLIIAMGGSQYLQFLTSLTLFGQAFGVQCPCKYLPTSTASTVQCPKGSSTSSWGGTYDFCLPTNCGGTTDNLEVCGKPVIDVPLCDPFATDATCDAPQAPCLSQLLCPSGWSYTSLSFNSYHVKVCYEAGVSCSTSSGNTASDTTACGMSLNDIHCCPGETGCHSGANSNDPNNGTTYYYTIPIWGTVLIIVVVAILIASCVFCCCLSKRPPKPVQLQPALVTQMSASHLTGAPVGAPPPKAPASMAPQLVTIQAPNGSYPGMQTNFTHPTTGQVMMATVPPGVGPGQTFQVQA